jgi:hypothetical protein
MVVAVKMALQPWSQQRRLIGMREPEKREGQRCAQQAAVGREGMFRSDVWLE